jgi:hypothetical protein
MAKVGVVPEMRGRNDQKFGAMQAEIRGRNEREIAGGLKSKPFLSIEDSVLNAIWWSGLNEDDLGKSPGTPASFLFFAFKRGEDLLWMCFADRRLCLLASELEETHLSKGFEFIE